MSDPWAPLLAELDRAGAGGRQIRFWLRDDDAIAATPALDRLAALCEAAGTPVLLAVIPAAVDDRLADWIGGHPAFTPCQHGYSHANHARAGERACELGGGRDPDDIIRELAAGRRRLQTLFGSRLSGILVPPWNRIDPGLLPALPGLGFSALSTFGRKPLGSAPGQTPAAPIPRLDSDLDVIDWRGGRVGRSRADVAGKLAAVVAAAVVDGAPVGILTHHLAHDETAWAVLAELLDCLRMHGAAEMCFPSSSA